jgi:hypothetical protein
MTGEVMSTYLVRIVSEWDRIKERLFQNEMEGRPGAVTKKMDKIILTGR